MNPFIIGLLIAAIAGILKIIGYTISWWWIIGPPIVGLILLFIIIELFMRWFTCTFKRLKNMRNDSFRNF
jgi:hypothetical protein